VTSELTQLCQTSQVISWFSWFRENCRVEQFSSSSL